MKIYERIYDAILNKDGTEKPNKLLGEFELLEGSMDDYSYEVIVRKKEDGKLYILKGVEVSGFYHPNEGGTRHVLEKLEDNEFVKTYLKYDKKTNQ